MKRLLLAGLAVVAVGLGVALAQNVQQQLTGSEAWQVGTGGPGGPGVYTNTTAMRGGRNYATFGSGGTFSTNISANVTNVIITSQAVSITMSLPSSPFDGEVFQVSCPGGPVTTIAVNATSNSGLFNPGPTVTGSAYTACNPVPAASGSAMYIFSTTPSPAQWYRVQ